MSRGSPHSRLQVPFVFPPHHWPCAFRYTTNETTRRTLTSMNSSFSGSGTSHHCSSGSPSRHETLSLPLLPRPYCPGRGMCCRKRLSGQLSPGESHVWPFQRFIQTDKAVYLLRQHIFSNLHDRLSTRPFLSDMEKVPPPSTPPSFILPLRMSPSCHATAFQTHLLAEDVNPPPRDLVQRWLVFQLLHSVAHSHTQGICHGDIKCENCLVTSWNWLFLTDFASYKPTLLPADNPVRSFTAIARAVAAISWQRLLRGAKAACCSLQANFSFFFDTGGRRRCYIAPERFYESSETNLVDPKEPLKQSMVGPPQSKSLCSSKLPAISTGWMARCRRPVVPFVTRASAGRFLPGMLHRRSLPGGQGAV